MTNMQTAAARSDTRVIGDIPGGFVFLDRDGPEWEAQVFSFMARSVSTSRAVVSADIEVARGERLALRFEAVGIRRGTVERRLKQGFIVSFVDADTAESSLDARLDWLNKKTRGRVENRRMHKRVLPRDGAARLILGADDQLDCRILDMSQSGAGIASTVQPPIGRLVAIGSVPGRVVRHLDSGFAVRFLELQDLAELEGRLTLRSAKEKALAAAKLGFAA